MTETWKFEHSRIFTRRNSFIFLLVIVICLYLVFNGIKQYNLIQDEIEEFKRYENLQFQTFLSYIQYGGYGFRVITKLPVLSIFFGGQKSFKLKSLVSVRETIDIDTSVKGKDFQINIDHYCFSEFIYIVGTLIALFLGVTTFRSRNSLRSRGKKRCVLSTVVVRCSIVVLIFAIALILSFCLPVLLGTSFSNSDIANYCLYSLFFLLLVAIFYLIGFAVNLIFISKKQPLIHALVIWLLIIFIPPEIFKLFLTSGLENIQANDVVNLQKLESYAQYERNYKKFAESLKGKPNFREITKRYIDKNYFNVYENNKLIENQLKESLTSAVENVQRLSVIFPTCYFYILSREVGGHGFRQYRDFFEFVTGLKDRFFKYYIKKRYVDPEQNRVERFIPVENQIYPLHSQLPYLSMGLIVFVIYGVFVMALALLFIYLKNSQDPGPAKKIKLPKLKPGEINFIYREKQEEKEQILNYLQHVEGGHVVRQVDGKDLESAKIKDWIRYACHIGKMNYQDALKYLDELEVPVEKNTHKVSHETVNRAYLALQLSRSADFYVFDDFLKGLSKEFEKKFFKLISSIKLIYISCEPYKFEKREKREKPGFTLIDLDLDVTFR